jgi:pimeloyl-ACP methyl ester carboxylesterase
VSTGYGRGVFTLGGVGGGLSTRLPGFGRNSASEFRRGVRASGRGSLRNWALRRGPLLLTVLIAVSAAACSDKEVVIPVTVDYPPVLTTQVAVPQEVSDQRGGIVSQSPLSDLDPSLSSFHKAWRAIYQSVAAVTGEQTEVSGAFFVPNGQPPDGGWPVIAVGHATTGLANGCGLSSERDLRGYAPAVAGFLNSGYAVALTDYEGLGDTGKHPFLEPRTAAFNVIDSVRALRALDPSVSPRWLAYGASQGGQAAWEADEMDNQYGEGLKLVGSVALAPAANIVGLSELAFRQELTEEQLSMAPMVIAGLARYDPTIVPSRFLRGTALGNLDELTGCGVDAGKARGQIRKDEVGPTTPAAAGVLTQALRKIALPQGPLDAPLLVINGLKDLTVLPTWTAAAVARSCALHSNIEHKTIEQDGHNDLFSDPAVSQLAMDWTADRFARIPALPNCPVRS